MADNREENLAALEDAFFENIFVSPKLAVPHNKEIVVIACILEGGEQIIQTAVYEQQENGAEAWYCGKPFTTLLYWYSLKNFERLAKSPKKLAPLDRKIVVVSCRLENGDIVYQTAIYLDHGKGRTEWIYGQKCEKILMWSSLPKVPERGLFIPKIGLIQ